MKRRDIPFQRLKDVAATLPPIKSGIKKINHAILGKNISNKKWNEIKSQFENPNKNGNELYRWVENTQLFVNHYEALIRVYSKSGEPGIEEYTISTKENHIKASKLRA